MAGAAVSRRLTWQLAEVAAVETQTARARDLTLDVDGWSGHVPGQHVDVRLTAADGYQATRSYSVASAPDEGRFVLTVERLDDGEVSPYLVDEVRPGDRFEVRGPLGGYFVWDAHQAAGEPVLLVAGGSGVAPLMSMLRHRLATGAAVPMTLLYSARSHGEVIYRDELETVARDTGVRIEHTLTREQPPGWTGFARRVDRLMLTEVAPVASEGARAYVCGPTAFVEAVATTLVEIGYAPEQVRTERFGATGGST